MVAIKEYLVDIGNSSIKIVDSENINSNAVHNFSYNNGKKKAVVDVIQYLIKNRVTKLKCCSVQLAVSRELRRCSLKAKIGYQEIEHVQPTNIKIFYNLNKIGVDRLTAVFSARTHYPDKNILLFDIGTAVTVEVIEGKNFIGGYIFPGLQTMANSLNSSTSLLPQVILNSKKSSIKKVATDSQDAIIDGCNIAMQGAINGFIKELTRLRKKDFKLIITGGGANYLLPLDYKYIYDPILIFKGIKIWSF